jgi:hypothetical protein
VPPGPAAVNGAGSSRGNGNAALPPGGRTPGRDSATVSLPPLDSATEASFLTYDATKKTLTFQLSAGDEIPSLVSFNAARRGGRSLIVPIGWRVTILFANRDPQLPHSATIVDVVGPIPEQLPDPIFPRGQTVKVGEGLLEGDADEIVFVADRVGRYAMACGVLGHAQRGQWLTLDVSTVATVPRYR